MTDFANLDMTRRQRTGMGESVYAPGKTAAQLLEIMRRFYASGARTLATKCSPEQANVFEGSGLPVEYDPTSRLLKMECGAPVSPLVGKVAVCCGGTADIPVAEEAAQTSEFFGAAVERYFDVGVAGIHRLLERIEHIRSSQVVIAVAGMEGALPGVVAGLVSSPVVAVPTSVGYGASFDGLAPLLTMMNACAEGVAVVNIDNGFGAGVYACRILAVKGGSNG